MRPVDADYVIRKMMENTYEYTTADINCVEDAPTLDVVPVVRCKDCLYYVPEVDDPHKSTCQRLWGGMTECNADSYCSDGVRKDEVENG